MMLFGFPIHDIPHSDLKSTNRNTAVSEATVSRTQSLLIFRTPS